MIRYILTDSTAANSLGRCCIALALAATFVALPAYQAPASDQPIVLAQAQDRDRDREHDGDWSDADRDRIRDRLRDGTCEVVAEAADEVVGALAVCLRDRDRLRDGSCLDRLDLGIEALERTRERCHRS